MIANHIQREFDTPDDYDQPKELGPSEEAVAIVEELDDHDEANENLRGLLHFDLGGSGICRSHVQLHLNTVSRDDKEMAQKAVDALLNAGFRYTGSST